MTDTSYLPPANEVPEGYVFAPVCNSVHMGGGVSAPVDAGIHTPRADTPLGRRPRPSRRLLLRTVRILLECILVQTKATKPLTVLGEGEAEAENS